MKIAVVGSAISGLSAAWLLNARHQVTLVEHRNIGQRPTADKQINDICTGSATPAHAWRDGTNSLAGAAPVAERGLAPSKPIFIP